MNKNKLNMFYTSRHSFLISALLLSASFYLLSIPAKAQSDTIRLEKLSTGHRAACLTLQHKLPLKAMLESGIPFPILDSTFVFQNSALLNLSLKPSEISMNLNGEKIRCYYQTEDTVFLNRQIYTGITLIANLRSRGIDMMYPVQTFCTPEDNIPSCIIELNLKRNYMRQLTRKELSFIQHQYSELTLRKGDYGKMYNLEAEFAIKDKTGKIATLRGKFIPDLGNIIFLALFENHPNVKDFIQNTAIPIQQGLNKKGQPMPVKAMHIKEGVFNKKVPFSNVVFMITPHFTQLESDGFLGLDFLRHFDVIFDFSNHRFYFKEADE